MYIILVNGKDPLSTAESQWNCLTKNFHWRRWWKWERSLTSLGKSAPRQELWLTFGKEAGAKFQQQFPYFYRKFPFYSAHCPNSRACLKKMGHSRFGSQSFWVTVVLGHSRFGSQSFWVTVVLSHSRFGSQSFWVTVVLGHSRFESQSFWVTVVLSHSRFGSQSFWVTVVLSHSRFESVVLGHRRFESQSFWVTVVFTQFFVSVINKNVAVQWFNRH